MVKNDMTLARLSELVGAYGASAVRWPEAERVAAEALLAGSADARALVAEARELDLLLDMAPSATASSDLAARIMAARPRAASGRIVSAGRERPGLWRAIARMVWPYGSPAFPAGALAASIMLGVTFGASFSSSIAAFGLTTTQVADSAATATGSGEQLVSLALAENDYPEDWKQ